MSTEQLRTSEQAATVRLWPALQFRDVDAMTAWLGAIGFVEHATHHDGNGTVVHAEWLWPGGGGLMFGAESATTVRSSRPAPARPTW